MTDYYCDPNAGGSDDGTSWTDAWSTLQRAINGTGGTTPAVGDTVFCRNSGAGDGETISSSITNASGNEGTTTTGVIKFVGVNSSGTNDGTRYLIDANSAATNCLLLSKDCIWWENFEVTGATGDGIYGSSTCYTNVFLNVYAHDNGISGFGDLLYYPKFFFCRAEGNTLNGAGTVRTYPQFFCCTFINNDDAGVFGIYDMGVAFFYGCVFHNNGSGDEGMNYSYTSTAYVHCVFDGETIGLVARGGSSSYVPTMFGCRFTNNTTAIGQYSSSDYIHHMAFCGFYGNTTNIDADLDFILQLPYDGVDSNDMSMAGDGYSDRSSDDFNLTSGSDMRREEVDLGIGT